MILERILLIVTVLLIVISLLLLVLLVAFLKTRDKLKKIILRKPKRRSRQRKWREHYRFYEQKNKRIKHGLLGLLILLVLVIGGGYLSYYFEGIALSSNDSENLAKSTYMIEELTEQLESPDEKISEKKRTANYHELAVTLASYSSKNPDNRGSEKGKLLLKRYYAQLGELGLNFSTQNYLDVINDQALKASNLNDIKKILTSQKELFDFYRINSKSL